MPSTSSRTAENRRPVHLHAARPEDLAGIEQVEARCFSPERRSARRALRHSLRSPAQSVWVLRRGDQITGVMVLFHRRKTLRIYSLAVLPQSRGTGGGRRLVRMALALARRSRREAVTLEADAKNERLIQWYAALGFCIYGAPLIGYYPNGDAVRMRANIPPVRPPLPPSDRRP